MGIGAFQNYNYDNNKINNAPYYPKRNLGASHNYKYDNKKINNTPYYPKRNLEASQDYIKEKGIKNSPNSANINILKK